MRGKEIIIPRKKQTSSSGHFIELYLAFHAAGKKENNPKGSRMFVQNSDKHQLGTYLLGETVRPLQNYLNSFYSEAPSLHRFFPFTLHRITFKMLPSMLYFWIL